MQLPKLLLHSAAYAQEVKEQHHIPMPIHIAQATRHSRLLECLQPLLHPDTVGVIVGYAAQIVGKLNWSHDYDEETRNWYNDVSHGIMKFYDYGDLLARVQTKNIGQLVTLRTFTKPPNNLHPQIGMSDQALQELLISLVGLQWEKCPGLLRIPTQMILCVSKPKSKFADEDDEERFYLCLPSHFSIFIFTQSRTFTRTVQFSQAIVPRAMCVDGDEIFLGDGGLEYPAVVMFDVTSGKEKQNYKFKEYPRWNYPRAIAVYGSDVFVLTPLAGEIQVLDRISGKRKPSIRCPCPSQVGAEVHKHGSMRIVQGNLVLQFGASRHRLQVFY